MNSLLITNRLGAGGLYAALLVAGATGASAATISGTVYDARTDQYVTGAEIVVLETGQSTYSARGGTYTLRDVPVGQVTLQAHAVGFPVETLTVTVQDRYDLLNAYFTLTDEVIYELDPIVVTGSLLGRAKALNIQKSSDNLVNVVSADAMGQFVDRNAAEALQRQPGITVLDSQGEGKFVVIRGSNPAWNQVMIDGVNVATPEENGRTTALNIISTDQLEAIEVTKSWLPDQPAGSVGGTVNLITRSALDRNQRFASIEGAWGNYDYAEDDSWRFNVVYGDVFEIGREDRKIGIQLSVNNSVDNRGSETLVAKDWVTSVTPTLQGAYPPGFSLNGLDYEDYSIKRDRFAVGGKIELQLNARNTFFVSASINRFKDTEILQELALNASTASAVGYRGTLYFNQDVATRLGQDLTDPAVIARLALPSNSPLKKLTYEEAEALGDLHFNPETTNYEHYIAAGDTQKLFQIVETDDKIQTYQVGGRHMLFEGFELDYSLSLSEAEKDWTNNGVFLDSPELSFVISIDPSTPYAPSMRVNNDLDQLLDPTTWVLNESHGRVHDHEYFSKDSRKGFTINGEYAYDLAGVPQSTKVGVAGDFREKEYRRNFALYSDIDTSPLAQLTLADAYFAGEPNYTFLSDSDGDYEFGPRFNQEATLDFLANTPDAVTLIQTANDLNYNITDAILRNYEASEDITGAYLMHKLTLWKWDLIAGARWERTENGFGNYVINTDLNGTFIIPGYWTYLTQDQYSQWVESERSYTDFLPALHIRREFGEGWVLRLSGTKAIARPTFTDLVPFEIVGIDGAKFARSIHLPNMDLQAMEATNYDATIERYLKGIGLMSVSAFYKNLNGAIYTETRNDVAALSDPIVQYYANKYIASTIEANASTWATSRMANTGAGKVYGVELAFDSKLRFLPWELDGLGISANYTLVDSEVELLMEERYKEKVPLFNQSKQSANFSIYYEKHGFLARVSYLLRGKYLSGVQSGETAMYNLGVAGVESNAFDTYADSYNRVDVLLRYTWKSRFSAFIEGTNLTNEPIRYYRGDVSRMSSIRYTGPIWFAGVKWSL